MECQGIVYLITNKINGKQYVGQTVQSIMERWSKHKYKSSRNHVMRLALDKYGTENFTIEPICSVFNIQDLNDIEISLIKSYNTMAPKGYNMTAGGDSPIYCEELKKKKSKASKRIWQNPKTKDIMQAAMQCPERKAKISEASKRLWNDPLHRQQMSIKMKKKWQNPSYKKMIMDRAAQGHKRPEVKERKSQIAKERWKDPKFQQSMKDHRVRINSDPSYRRKLETKGSRIYQFDLYQNLIAEYECISDCLRSGFNKTSVASAANGQSRTYRGYIWRYESGVQNKKPVDIPYKKRRNNKRKKKLK